jgi:hypothetical protein
MALFYHFIAFMPSLVVSAIEIGLTGNLEQPETFSISEALSYEAGTWFINVTNLAQTTLLYLYHAAR